MEYNLYKTEKEQRKWANKYLFFHCRGQFNKTFFHTTLLTRGLLTGSKTTGKINNAWFPGDTLSKQRGLLCSKLHYFSSVNVIRFTATIEISEVLHDVFKVYLVRLHLALTWHKFAYASLLTLDNHHVLIKHTV